MEKEDKNFLERLTNYERRLMSEIELSKISIELNMKRFKALQRQNKEHQSYINLNEEELEQVRKQIKDGNTEKE